MHIGIHASNTRSAGGQFQFLLMFLEGLRALQTKTARSRHRFSLVCFSDEQDLCARYCEENSWGLIDVPLLLGVNKATVDLRQLRRDSLKQLPHLLGQESGLDFIFFPTWTESCAAWGVPFSFHVHDLEHRVHPEFPEVSLGKTGGGSWRWREEFFSTAFAAAQFATVDCEVGRELITKYYGLPKEHIQILPPTVPVRLLSSEGSSVNFQNLPSKFFFYPAQFWPHKNHYRIVEALGLLKSENNLRFDFVFSGGSFLEFPVRENCEALARSMGVEEQLHFLGYVSDLDIEKLYQRASGLVMPSFFGPTNVPYLEAFANDCPVIASDISGIREQLGDAALLVDPYDTRALANAMEKLYLDLELAQNLRARGRKRLQQFSPAVYAEHLARILERLQPSITE